MNKCSKLWGKTALALALKAIVRITETMDD
jgi:hypothetical protein